MKLERDAAGCFVILDVDSFKRKSMIRYGHPEGDRVLREVADHLRKAVGSRASSDVWAATSLWR